MFYKLTLKAENKMYAVGWHEGETRESRGIMYYIFKKEWHYVGPELMDIIVGFDPDEDWEWGFHILPEMAEKMNISNENYKKYAKDRAGKSPVLKDTCLAFVFGGGICAAAQCIKELYRMAGADEQSLKTWVPCTVIFITAILTGLGLFEKIARHAGAGTLVPISGFANDDVGEQQELEYEIEMNYCPKCGRKLYW